MHRQRNQGKLQTLTPRGKRISLTSLDICKDVPDRDGDLVSMATTLKTNHTKDAATSCLAQIASGHGAVFTFGGAV